MNTKPRVDLNTHNHLVVAQATSDLNKWGTGEELNRPPDTATTQGRNELFFHYIKSGGIAHLQEEHELVSA